MQFSVPQFIDVEDKVVGPFTGKQALYLMVGGGVLLLCFTFFNIFFFFLVAIVVAPVTLAFVFYRPRGVTLAQFLGNALEYYTTNHLYFWRREPESALFKAVQKRHTIEEAPMKTVTRSRIRELANLLDTSAAVNMPYETETRPDEDIFRK